MGLVLQDHKLSSVDYHIFFFSVVTAFAPAYFKYVVVRFIMQISSKFLATSPANLTFSFLQESKLYGSHFKEITADAPKATKITFSNSDDED